MNRAIQACNWFFSPGKLLFTTSKKCPPELAIGESGPTDTTHPRRVPRRAQYRDHLFPLFKNARPELAYANPGFQPIKEDV